MLIKDLLKNYIYPISVFAGGMIGVGFLSLPYIATKVGIWVMLLYFVFLTALVVAINLIFAEISLKTPDFKRFPGFVFHYLGKTAGIFSFFSVIFGTLGVLLVYLIVGGQFLVSAFSVATKSNILFWTIIYFFIVSIIIFFDIKAIKKAEFWVLLFLFVSLIFIFLNGSSYLKVSHFLFSEKDLYKNLFLPYGAMLFSLWGVGLIPETEEMMRGNKKRFKKVITISTILVSVFYFVFTSLVLGITGGNTTQTALTGIKVFLGNGVASLALLIGTLATFTAFITQGIILKKVLMYDLKIKHRDAFIITCCTPLILFLIGLNSFVPLISFIGGVLLGIDGIMILLIYKKMKGDKLVTYSLSIIFLLGIIYQLIYFIKK